MATEKQNIFDFAEGKRLKEEGIGRAVSPDYRAGILDEARYCAHLLGKMDYQSGLNKGITADDIWRMMIDRHAEPELLGKAWGSVWRGTYAHHFKPAGTTRKSERASNHARPLAVWYWRP